MDEILDYLSVNVEMGIIVWIVKPCDTIKIGVKAGSLNTRYVEVRFKGKRFYAHNIVWRIAYGYWPKMLDHKNRNKRDNRLVNLREATKSQNQYNRTIGKNNQSGYIGVSWKTSVGKWRASITVGYEYIELGYFDEIKDAVECRRQAAIHYHGKFSSEYQTL